MKPLCSALRKRVDKVDRTKYPFADLQPITIHFDGSVDKRDVATGREYSMDLYFAHPADIVVAKIDLKNGAVGIVPHDWHNVVVTGHFAVYQPDLTRLDPQYLHLLIQTPQFKGLLWRNKVGAEGRKEVKLDFFENVQIPIPPTAVQHAIVAHWRTAQDAIAKANARIACIEKQTAAGFLADLGLTLPERTPLKKAFAVHWEDFERWTVSYSQAASSIINLTLGKYSVAEVGSILDMVQYGTSQKANTSGKGTPVLRMNNIKDGRIDFAALKYVTLPGKVTKSLLLKNGDILFNRTNSKELVGKCAVFPGKGEYVFASYLIRVRVARNTALSDFLAYSINSPIGRQQIDALSRQIIGQANINSQELRSLRIPLPPLKVQQAIMRRVETRWAEIARQREAADRLRRETQTEVEEMILGTRPVK